MKFYKYIKRLADIFFSAAGIILFSPLLLLLLAACAADTGASPVFLQERMGKGGKTFKIFKFRTMKKSAPEQIPARDISGKPAYLSRFGEFLRKSGLDELPQLFNILCGKMSFVGPRPLMLSERALHREREKLGVYNVCPGLTGPAQIMCESIGSFEEKAKIDGAYARNISFWGDFKIILATALRFLRGKSIEESFHSPQE